MVVATAAARVADAEGTALGVVALFPTVGLILAIALLVDISLSQATPGAGAPVSGSAVALALAAALDAAPPRSLAIELVLAGATSARAGGMRRHVGVHRRALRDRDAAVLWLGDCGHGDPRWRRGEGEVLRVRFHPLLNELCERLAAEDPELRAEGRRARGLSGARPARARGLGAIAVETADTRGGRHDDTAVTVDDGALQGTLALCLGLVAALDDELASRR